MKIHDKKMSATSFPLIMKLLGGAVAASCSLFVFDTPAHATSIGGDSTSILRIREGEFGQSLVPLYEYLHLQGSNADKNGETSIHLGGWGRIDWGDKSTDSTSNGDVQYGFLSYRANKNNLQVQAGRQYITEGVISDKVDGLYVRTDLPMRFTAAGFIGSPATTVQSGFDGGGYMFGGRIAHTVPSLYSVGLSYLHTQSGDATLREEEGVDLWLHPLAQVDIAGRSVYNSATSGWNEHDYTLSVTPLEALRLSATLQKFDYRQYFHYVTTSALSVRPGGTLDPREELFSVGGTVGYTFLKNFNAAADYKHYSYDVQGDANYFGGGVTFLAAGDASAGLFFHRMDGDGQRLRYNEYRVYVSKKIAKADLTLDFIDDSYDASINRVDNTYSFSAAAGYDVTPNLRFAADLEYMKSIDYDNDLRGLLKVVYLFGSERRGK